MDMRRLSTKGGAQPGSDIEARLAEFRNSGGTQGSQGSDPGFTPTAAQSMVDIPRSPIYPGQARRARPLQPAPPNPP